MVFASNDRIAFGACVPLLKAMKRDAYSHTERASKIVQCHPRTWVSGVIHFICLCASVSFVSLLSSTFVPKICSSRGIVCG